MKSKTKNSKFTVIGSGFIATSLTEYLEKEKYQYAKLDLKSEKIPNRSLGNIIYAIGITLDFDKNWYKAVDAHVCKLIKLLKNSKFDSFLYISSTRVYQHSESTKEENPIILKPNQEHDVYNASKILGESICLSLDDPSVRVVRLSNVIGNNFNSNLFLPMLLRNAVTSKKMIIKSTLDSEKDYVYIDDVVRILPRISLNGSERLYNVAYGKNIKTSEIVKKIQSFVKCNVSEEYRSTKFKLEPINIKRISKEFQFKPVSVLGKIETLLNSYEKFFSN